MSADYLTAVFTSMAAGAAFLAAYLWEEEREDPRAWALAFALPGLVLSLTGLHMALTQPLPGTASAVYGEPALLFGVLLLGKAWALAQGWDRRPVSAYAFFAGLATLLLAFRLGDYEETGYPLATGIAYVLLGGTGLMAWPVQALLRGHRAARFAGGIVLLAAAILFVVAAYGHLTVLQFGSLGLGAR